MQKVGGLSKFWGGPDSPNGCAYGNCYFLTITTAPYILAIITGREHWRYLWHLYLRAVIMVETFDAHNLSLIWYYHLHVPVCAMCLAGLLLSRIPQCQGSPIVDLRYFCGLSEHKYLEVNTRYRMRHFGLKSGGTISASPFPVFCTFLPLPLSLAFLRPQIYLENLRSAVIAQSSHSCYSS